MEILKQSFFMKRITIRSKESPKVSISEHECTIHCLVWNINKKRLEISAMPKYGTTRVR